MIKKKSREIDRRVRERESRKKERERQRREYGGAEEGKGWREGMGQVMLECSAGKPLLTFPLRDTREP